MLLNLWKKKYLKNFKNLSGNSQKQLFFEKYIKIWITLIHENIDILNSCKK